MSDPNQIAAELRTRAAEYEAKAAGALTRDSQTLLRNTATTYRRLADQIDANPPRWLQASD
jgi:phage shock protein A